MFSMNLGSGESGGHVVVALRGELDFADSSGVAAFLGSVAARAPWVIVDLSGLEFIDVSGARALSHGRGLARSAGGELLLAAPQVLVQRVLTLIWETSSPGIYPSMRAAAARLRPLVTPARRQPPRMRGERIAMNAFASERRWGTRRPLAPGRWPSAAGWISAGQPASAD